MHDVTETLSRLLSIHTTYLSACYIVHPVSHSIIHRNHWVMTWTEQWVTGLCHVTRRHVTIQAQQVDNEWWLVCLSAFTYWYLTARLWSLSLLVIT